MSDHGESAEWANDKRVERIEEERDALRAELADVTRRLAAVTADRDHERETRLRGEREKELAGELAEAVRLLRDGHYDGQCSGHGSYPCLNCETTAFLARHPDDAGEDGT